MLPVFSPGPGRGWASDHHWGLRLWRARQPAACAPVLHPGPAPRPHYAPGPVRGARQDWPQRTKLQETERQEVSSEQGWPGVTWCLSGHGSRAGESETGGGSCSCKSQYQVIMITLQTWSVSRQTCQTLLWLVWNCKDDWSVSGYCRSVMRRWGQLSTWIPATLTSQWCDHLTKWRYPEALHFKCTGCKSVNNNYCNKIADVKTHYHFM